MQLETDRLILRDWAPQADAQQAFDIYGDPAVTHWIGGGEADASWYETQARLQRYRHRSVAPAGIWAVIEKALDRIIGTLLLVPLPRVPRDKSPDEPQMEIGWHFRQASWGYGYATEAARCIMSHALAHFPAVYAVALPDNHRSIQVMKRLGMADLGLTQRYYDGRTLALFRRRAA